MPAPLKNVKLLDFSHLLPGELCSTILADLGCEVVRIEPLKPGLGQTMPPLVKGESLYYWSVHRHKRRLRVNLKTDEGRQIICRLAQQADIVLENFRPGVMTRLGAGPKQLRKLNSRLIYCSISGYGSDTSWAQRPGHDLNLIAESGILNLNRRSGEAPVMPGALISDFLAAVYAALSVSSALFERTRTGKGRHLDISMFDCALSTMNILSTALLYQPAESSESTHQYDLPNYNIYKCKDGRYLAVAALEPQFWHAFCQAIERPDLMSFKGGPDQALKQDLAGIIASKTLADWRQIFQEVHCCVSPVNNLSEALTLLPVRERELLTNLLHPLLGLVPQLKTPVARMSDDQWQRSSASFAVNDESDDELAILREAGYSRRAIIKLKQAGVLLS